MNNKFQMMKFLISEMINQCRLYGKIMHVMAFVVLTFGIISPYPAYASDQSGTVTRVAFADGRFLFWLSGPRIGSRPTCDCCSRWELTVSNANTQGQMTLIMTAYAQSKTLTVVGTGVCVAGSNDTEGFYYIQTE